MPIHKVGGTLLGELRGICHIANSCRANGCFHSADILYIDLSAHREPTRVSQYSAGKPHPIDICLGLKTGSSTPTCTDTHATQRETEPHFGGFSSHVFLLFIFFALHCGARWKPPEQERSDCRCRSWSSPTKPSDSEKGSVQENDRLLLQASGLNNSPMHACFLQSHLLLPSQSCPSSADILPQL